MTNFDKTDDETTLHYPHTYPRRG